MIESNKKNFRTHLAFMLASVFAAWGSYLIHVIPIEEPSLPILEALIELSGRAPDQYRVVPYLLIGLIQDAINSLPGIDVELRYPVLIFDSVFLYLSVMSIRKHFDSIGGQSIQWFLLLIYPFLMFDGYRPTASFILFLSIHIVVFMRNANAGNKKAWFPFTLLIVLMSFTRADVAILFAVSALGLANASMLLKICVAIVPLAVQVLLSTVIFSDAEYFSQLVMISDNLSLRFLASSPLTYFLIALLVGYWPSIINFIKQVAKTHVFVLVAMCGYVVTLFVIARLNEYRLFLPFLPLVLWLIDEQKNRVLNCIQK
jgi:hypothetical protein